MGTEGTQHVLLLYKCASVRAGKEATYARLEHREPAAGIGVSLSYERRPLVPQPHRAIAEAKIFESNGQRAFNEFCENVRVCATVCVCVIEIDGWRERPSLIK